MPARKPALFASFDAGEHWSSFGLKNLPDVAVRDIFLQPEENDILLATHGRGLWILDDATPVQQIAAAAHAATLFPDSPGAALFRARHALGRRRDGVRRAQSALRRDSQLLSARNRPRRCASKCSDSNGKVIRTLRWSAGAGERGTAPRRLGSARHRNGCGGGGGRGRGGQGGRGPQVFAGNLHGSPDGRRRGRRTEAYRCAWIPELKVTMADLQQQWDALAKLSAMIREVARNGSRSRPS